MKIRVVFDPRAIRDLTAIYSYIRDRTGPRTAKNFTDRIRDYCQGFATFPERGQLRPDLGTQVQVVGFERTTSIVFAVRNREIVILGVYYGGRLIEGGPDR